MPRELELERLRGRTLFVGTPMYDGRCHSEFALAAVRLGALCARLGIETRFSFACHEALVTRARNLTVDEFLRSGFGHLLFVDADIGFDPWDALRLLGLQVLDAECRTFDVVAAPYPIKRISWRRVLAAAKAGLADAEPDLLARYASPVAVHPLGDDRFAIEAPVEVTQAGTGFMMVRRETFERYRAHHPGRAYRAEPAGGDDDRAPEHYAFFETEIDSKHDNIADEMRGFLARNPEATPAEMRGFLDGDDAANAYRGGYVSEDYAFCRRVRAAGMRVWLCPWMELSHTGSHRFTSRVADLGALPVDAGPG